MQRLREFDGVALAADMHVEHGRGGPQQVIVNGRDFDSVVDQAFHYRADLILGQHQIAHEHGTVPRGQETDP